LNVELELEFLVYQSQDFKKGSKNESDEDLVDTTGKPQMMQIPVKSEEEKTNKRFYFDNLYVEPQTKSEGPPEKLQKMQIPFRSVKETNKMFHAGALTPSPEELQEMHFPVRSVEETNKKLFHVRPPSPSPKELQEMHIPVKSVEGAKKMFHGDSSRDSSPSPEELQEMHFPVRSVEETNKKLFHVRPPTPSPEELQEMHIPVNSVEGAKKMFHDDFKSVQGTKKMFHGDSSRDSSPFNSPESSPEKLQTKQIPRHIEPLKALEMLGDDLYVEKDSKNEDKNPLVEIPTMARWTSDEIEKLMDDNSWAFGTRFHPDPMALETEFHGRQVHPLHPIFPGIIPIASTAESQKIWRPFSTGSELQNQDKSDGEIRKKRPVRRAGF